MILATGAALTGGAGSSLGLAQDSAPQGAPAAPATAPPIPPAPAEKIVRAAGGQGILASAERALVVATGTIANPRKLDTSGWTADLAVDRRFVGETAAGATLQIAWEELAASRQVRFDQGERILVVLEPLPAQSLWQKRFPDAGRHVYAVANRGEAFLRSPTPSTLDSLEHYLAMAGDARKGQPGVRRLAEMVASSAHALAREALDMLEARTDLAAALGDEGGAILLQAARFEGRDPAVRARALQLAAKSGLRGVKEAALALSQPGSPLRADAYRALGIIPHGLTPEQAAKLLEDGDPEVRVVGVILSTDPAKREQIAKIARTDAAATVRLMAGTTLLIRYRDAAFSEVLPMLDDEDVSVRTGIARVTGQLGSVAVEPLRDVVEKGSEKAALAAVAGLAKAGQEGALALVSISKLHPSEAIRAAADLTLGKGPSKAHGHTH